MPQQVSTAVENNFTKGLLTEFTGLNFPENAATDTDNCVYSLIGDVNRRDGFNFEENFATNAGSRQGMAMNTYRWNNVGGSGIVQFLVSQVGSNIFFYNSSAATVARPISSQIILSSINIVQYQAPGNFNDVAVTECQFTDGNGYLFVFHPDCDPFYCSYNAATNTVTSTSINVTTRDFAGIAEPNLSVTNRPTVLTPEHLYNLKNQGWTSSPAWGAESIATVPVQVGVTYAFPVGTGLPINLGDPVNIFTRDGNIEAFLPPGVPAMYGTVSFYGSGIVNIFIASQYATIPPGTVGTNWSLYPVNFDFVGTWHTAFGNYPSNADVWWSYKDSSDVFNPATTISNVTQDTGSAPKGHFLLSAFNQQRSLIGAVTGLTDVKTSVRPRTGTWFQGRVWYTGVDASQVATGDAAYYTWTSNIYFSQIVTDNTQFGLCYQQNDPTSETLFDLLPDDGGVIVIPEAGNIYKLFPIQNGMLVFAANGIWFITGSQGIGFTANDYTITKISGIESIASTSFVNVQGLPYFWNEEGVYTITPAQQGLGLSVDSITVSTILSFYNDIPLQSKKFVRGDYNPIDYVIQWIYRDTEETSVTDRYEFNKVLSYSTYNKAFFPYTLEGIPKIHSVNYIVGPGGSTSPDPVFKYFTSYPVGGGYNFTFSQEYDERLVDFFSYDLAGADYESYFVTGYKLRGQGIKKFQPQYVQVYSRTNDAPSSYRIQGIWNYANNRNSGKWSGIQKITNKFENFDVVFHRHKIRGSGFSLQFKILSNTGEPFDIIGWAVVDTTNQGT